MNSFQIGETVKIEFEESVLETKQIECKITGVSMDVITLDFADVSPYYYQYLYEGREIKLFLYSLSGIDIFNSMILTSPIDGKFEVELPPVSKNIQRRQYVRATKELRMFFIVANKVTPAKSVDVSGNGVRFFIEVPLEFGAKYNGELYLPEKIKIPFTGCVIKVIKSDRYEYVLEFSKLNEHDRDKIIKFCLAEQSKIINRKKNSL